MQHITITLSLLLAAALAAAAERAHFNPPANASSVTISGVSTIHEWTMQGSTINGSIDVEQPGVANALVSVRIPVANITSEHDRMNRIMLDAMKAKTYPEIRYELTEASGMTGTAESFVVKTRGKLTVAGVTRDVQMDVTASKSGERRYILSGTAPLKMTDFGIKPPTAMMGAIKSADDIKVSFHWVVDRQ